MTAHPIVSVCMPVYNGENYIGQALDSLLSQTFCDFEVVIVDDSDDSSAQIINAYKDPRIRYFKNPKRLNSVKAYNQSVVYARGRYIKIMHHDDILMPECLEAQTKILESDSELGFVFNDCYIINNKSDIVFERRLKFKAGAIGAKEVLKKFICQVDFNFIGETTVVMFRKDAFFDVGLFNETMLYSNDIELWARMNMKYKCFYLNRPLTMTRLHNQQIAARLRGIRCSLNDNRQLFGSVLKYKNVFWGVKILLLFEFCTRIPLIIFGKTLRKILARRSDMLLIYHLELVRRKLSVRFARSENTSKDCFKFI